jgi:hypothetical protein
MGGMDEQPENPVIPPQAKTRAWRSWAGEAIAFPFLGPFIHLVIASRGRSDLEELLGMLFLPAIYVVIGLYLCGRRRDRVLGTCPDVALRNQMRSYAALSALSLIFLAVFEAGCVILWSAILYSIAPAQFLAGVCAVAWVVSVIVSAFAHLYYLFGVERAILLTKSIR